MASKGFLAETQTLSYIAWPQQLYTIPAVLASAIWIRALSSAVTLGCTSFPRYISLGMLTFSLSKAVALKVWKPIPHY